MRVPFEVETIRRAEGFTAPGRNYTYYSTCFAWKHLAVWIY